MSRPSTSDDRRGDPGERRDPGEPERAAARAPLAERLRAERRAARARIAARVERPPSAEQRADDPLARGRLSAGTKLAVAAAAVVASSIVHGGIYGVGSLLGGDREEGLKRDIVAIQVREREREPDRPPPPPPVPEPERIVKPRPERQKAEPPPPPDVPPPPSPRGKPPPRVVGLSFDSTSQGGSGPSFGVGNTREGRTAQRAADPKKVDRAEPPSANQAASRIPTGGAKYVLPKRKRPIEPPYPEKLKTQGIEGAVTVMVSLDVTGKVTGVKVIRSSGFAEFDESARKTALAESFAPASRDGTAIPYTLSYTYHFTLMTK
jgi:protein TonB